MHTRQQWMPTKQLWKLIRQLMKRPWLSCIDDMLFWYYSYLFITDFIPLSFKSIYWDDPVGISGQN